MPTLSFFRRRLLWAMLAAFLALCLPAAAQAQEAMRWSTLIDDSEMYTVADGQRIALQAYDPEIYFDPTRLRSSRMVIRGNFDIPFIDLNKTEKPERIRTNLPNSGIVADTPGLGVFTSRSFQRADKNTFTVDGMFALNGRQHPAQATFRAHMAPDLSGTAKKLVIDGFFDITPQQYASAALPGPSASRMRVHFNYQLIPYTGGKP